MFLFSTGWNLQARERSTTICVGARAQATVAHHQRRPPKTQEATALTPTCDLLLAVMGPESDTGRSQSGEFGTSSNTHCGEGSR